MTQNTQATLRYKNVEIVEEVEKMERLKKQSTQELVVDATNRIIQGYESKIKT